MIPKPSWIAATLNVLSRKFAGVPILGRLLGLTAETVEEIVTEEQELTNGQDQDDR